MKKNDKLLKKEKELLKELKALAKKYNMKFYSQCIFCGHSTETCDSDTIHMFTFTEPNEEDEE